MKKHIKTIAAVVSLTIALSGLTTVSAEPNTNITTLQTYNINNIVGGWEINDGSTSLNKNPEAKDAFLKARKAATNVKIQPIAFLGSQVVAGTNYCFLCKVTAVSPDAKPEIALVYVYKDLKGNAEITGYQTIIGKQVPGGFNANDGKFKLGNNKLVKKAYREAMKDTPADAYEPVAYLGDQVVAGSNYMILARGTGTNDVAKGLYLIIVYADLDGNAEINRIESLELGHTDNYAVSDGSTGSPNTEETQSFVI